MQDEKFTQALTTFINSWPHMQGELLYAASQAKLPAHIANLTATIPDFREKFLHEIELRQRYDDAYKRNDEVMQSYYLQQIPADENSTLAQLESSIMQWQHDERDTRHHQLQSRLQKIEALIHHAEPVGDESKEWWLMLKNLPQNLRPRTTDSAQMHNILAEMLTQVIHNKSTLLACKHEEGNTYTALLRQTDQMITESLEMYLHDALPLWHDDDACLEQFSPKAMHIVFPRLLGIAQQYAPHILPDLQNNITKAIQSRQEGNNIQRVLGKHTANATLSSSRLLAELTSMNAEHAGGIPQNPAINRNLSPSGTHGFYLT